MRKVSFSKTELAGGLASPLDWAASSNCEVTEWPDWTFCPVVLQLAWRFSFSACLACVQLLAACKSRATREIQSQVPNSLHNLEHFFTLSHTLPLHDSHLNTGLLIAKIQVNLARNKANKMIDNIQPYKLKGKNQRRGEREACVSNSDFSSPFCTLIPPFPSL